ncbi:Lysophospholipase D gdpd1 [Clydaea vesicula]|uniref:Lysophospholipase D gdpd1 n=1 Tax=Clydaea vesicula TaxID=447962 RepID=A0AAD5U8N6_9FUNG|nr:Lysophospholipase D gdpd1 [Clydaea vesicula]KAJ3396028.1 Lysophospholipase D gdpd1 [Lobulomyces angularis]
MNNFLSNVQLMSHRGGSHEHVENTIAAFRYSANVLDVDILELDCHLTKDKQVVVFHDKNLQRVCGIKNKKISDYNFDELPKLLLSENLIPNNAVDKNNLDHVSIPKLQCLFDEFKDKKMHIDIKSGPEELVLKVGNMIKEYRREHLTIWGSGVSYWNDMCYKHFGNTIPLCFSLRGVLWAYFLWVIGFFWAYAGNRYQFMCIPNKPMLMKPEWFKALNKLGIPVVIWGLPNGGVNTIEGFEEVLLSGANGICTDRPTLLKEWLKNNKLADVVENDAAREKVEVVVKE